MKVFYLWDRFEYYVKKSARPKKKFEIKPCSTFFSDGATQSEMETINVTSDCLLFPHQVAPPLQSVGDHAHTSVQLSHLPSITLLNFFTNLVLIPSSCHMHFVPQPLSSYSANPADDTVLLLGR